MSASPFSKRAAVLLAAAATTLMLLSVLLHAYDTSPQTETRAPRYRPGSYSVSAIGSAGFYETLRRTGRPAIRSTGDTLARIGMNGTLIVAEPDLYRIQNEDGLRLMDARRLLLVLPKWMGSEDGKRPAWIGKAEPFPLYYPQQTLALITTRGEVLRAPWPEEWDTNRLGIDPSPAPGSGAVQLIRSRALKPVVGTAEGMLVGEYVEKGKRAWILADPDIMANHGLGVGDNAAFMLALIDGLRSRRNDDARVPIVFDETVHGFRDAEQSPIKLLFRFPFVVVTGLALASALILVLAGSGRFGAPRPPRPELDFGKAALINNGARLLDYAGYHGVTLIRYIRMTVRLVAHTLHAPPGLDESAMTAWLDRVGKARGASLSCARTLDAVNRLNPDDLSLLFGIARDIFTWKGELLHGSSTDRHHS